MFKFHNYESAYQDDKINQFKIELINEETFNNMKNLVVRVLDKQTGQTHKAKLFDNTIFLTSL